MSANINTDIRTTIEGLISTTFPTTAIAWQNVPFTPPNALWIRPVIGYGGEAPVAMRRDSLVGVVVVEVFVPMGKGAKLALQTIETIKSAFFRQRVGNIRFTNVLAVRQLTDNPAYLGYAIDIAFQANSTS